MNRAFPDMWACPVHRKLALDELHRGERELGESLGALLRRRAFWYAAPKAPEIPAVVSYDDLKSRMDRDQLRLLREVCGKFERHSFRAAFDALSRHGRPGPQEDFPYELLAQAVYAVTVVPPGDERRVDLVRAAYEVFTHHGFTLRSVSYREVLASAGCLPEQHQIDDVWEHAVENHIISKDLNQLMDWGWWPSERRVKGLQKAIEAATPKTPEESALLARAALHIEGAKKLASRPSTQVCGL